MRMTWLELRRAVERVGLPAWFVAIDLLWIARPNVLAVDAVHYQRAANAWLDGGNPWTVTQNGIPFAAGPHTLAFYVPTSLLPAAVSAGLWMAIGLVSGAWLVRRLGLPAWWLLFPPLAHAIWNGNPQTLALALLVTGGPIAASLAVAVKLYAGLALVRRWRDAVVVAAVLAVSLPLLPWRDYLEQGLGVSAIVSTAWNGSAWRLPILIPAAALALWLLRRNGAEWFAVPALWPGTQFYYAAMALPALVGHPVLAAAFALPMPLIAPLTVMGYAALLLYRAEAAKPDGLLARRGPVPVPATGGGSVPVG